jgi:hypothetical protein
MWMAAHGGETKTVPTFERSVVMSMVPRRAKPPRVPAPSSGAPVQVRRLSSVPALPDAPVRASSVNLSVGLEVGGILRVMTKEGEPLLEVVREASGPVVRLLQAAARIDLPGALRIEADAIELRARTGEVRTRPRTTTWSCAVGRFA